MTGNLGFGALKLRKGKFSKSKRRYRMKESKVLVVNLIGSVTELCRHLVLSGINLEIVNEASLIDTSHFESDFLFCSATDFEKKKSDVIAEKLRLMNPFASITTT